MDQLNSEAGQMEPNGLVEAKKTFGMYTNFVSIDYLDLVTADYDYFQFYVREMENNTAVNLQMHFYLAHPSMNREDRSKIVETGQVPILPEFKFRWICSSFVIISEVRIVAVAGKWKVTLAAEAMAPAYAENLGMSVRSDRRVCTLVTFRRYQLSKDDGCRGSPSARI